MGNEQMTASRELDAKVAELLGATVDRDWPYAQPADDAFWYEPENRDYFASIGVRPHMVVDYDQRGVAIRETGLDGVVRRRTCPSYSTDIASAFEVVEAMRAKGWRCRIQFDYGDGGHLVQFWPPQARRRAMARMRAVNPSLPFAISLAALAALQWASSSTPDL